MQFLRNAWYAAGWSSELAGAPVARTFLNEPIVMYRSEAGLPVALADMCAHRFAPLSLGRVSGDTIRCPYHGLVFDSHGTCVHNPHGKGQRPAAMKVREYPLVEQEGVVWIWMGDRERISAGPPSFSFLTAPGFRTVTGYLHVDANYELVTDNLMDLSHVEFLHPFIGPEGSAAGTEYHCEVDGDRIAALHRMPGQSNTGLFALLIGDDVKLVDGQADTHWQAPANLYIEAGARSLDQEVERHAVLPQAHLLTPETERSAHYFWGISRSVRTEDEQLDAMLLDGISKAFAFEDEPMIRAVQQRMGAHGLFDMRPALLPMDEGSVRARRVLARMIEDERRQSIETTAA